MGGEGDGDFAVGRRNQLAHGRLDCYTLAQLAASKHGVADLRQRYGGALQRGEDGARIVGSYRSRGGCGGLRLGRRRVDLIRVDGAILADEHAAVEVRAHKGNHEGNDAAQQEGRDEAWDGDEADEAGGTEGVGCLLYTSDAADE